MTTGSSGTKLAAAGAAGTCALLLGLIILAGGGSVAHAAPGLRPGTVPKQYRQWVLKAGGLCSETVGPAAIAAQIDAESGWNPHAVSPVGAQGLTQFMPGTWARWGRDADGDGRTSPFDPPDAIMAQGRYMCSLAQTVSGYLADGAVQGDVLDLALAAYNAGPGAVLAAGGIPHNGQTELYVAKIRRLMGNYSAITSPSGSTLGKRIVAAAASQLGEPYVWGGGNYFGPTGGGFDCSGLVMYALYQASDGRIALAEHLADYQARQGQPVTGPAPGSQINMTLLRPGDVIGFANPGSSTFHHIGIYAGHGKLIHAPTFGEPVKISDLSGAYWQHQIWQVRRFQ
jgi:cell wall-associated NlpC family hydrolase